MSQDAGDENDEELESAVQLRRKREEFWRRTGERSLWQNVSMIGALGWLIVTPTLLGVLIGRWLDVRFGTGIFWSGALIMLGAAFGGYLAWQRIEKE
jgi:ATP synthase protein I